MNVMFLTLLDFDSLQERNIYTDLLREFVKNGHEVCVISPVEKRKGVSTHIIEEKNAKILKLQIGNTQKTNIIEKGISTVMIEPTFKRAIKKYFSKIVGIFRNCQIKIYCLGLITDLKFITILTLIMKQNLSSLKL